MGFKEDTKDMLGELNSRVTALEALARTLRSNGVGSVSTGRHAAPVTAVRDLSAGHSVLRRDPVDGASVGRATGVDTDAIAFGLSEIKREVTEAFGNATAVASKHVGVVQYFSDVLAKADPSFDAVDFARKANA